MISQLAADTRILWRLLRGHPKSGDHAADLEGFYADQADAYDAFRERLLPGRAELYAGLSIPPGGRLVEMGAGTGRNLDWLGNTLSDLGQVDLIDLCEPLLAQARRRWLDNPRVACHLGDACTWSAGPGSVDVVVFAYSLTMIPDWHGALNNAVAMLRPGGQLAVVDFTVAPEQSAIARSFWKSWFGHDGVRLDLAHLPVLRSLAPDHRTEILRTRLPYLPGLAVPYYLFIGTRR